jgi:circadian clock protein KaiC
LRSIGLNLDQWAKKNLLQFHSSRATFYGLEMHLAMIHKLVEQFQPHLVVLDPIDSLVHAGTRSDANIALVRIVDFLKVGGITTVMTDLTSGRQALEHGDLDISSLVDSWLLLRDIESSGERNRAIYILKSRGMAHSNQIREFVLSAAGIDLLDVYIGPEAVLTGASRVAQEARERAAQLSRELELERRKRERMRRREALEARILALRKEFDAEDEEAQRLLTEGTARDAAVVEDRVVMAAIRQADSARPSRMEVSFRSRDGKASKIRRAASSQT